MVAIEVIVFELLALRMLGFKQVTVLFGGAEYNINTNTNTKIPMCSPPGRPIDACPDSGLVSKGDYAVRT